MKKSYDIERSRIPGWLRRMLLIATFVAVFLVLGIVGTSRLIEYRFRTDVRYGAMLYAQKNGPLPGFTSKDRFEMILDDAVSVLMHTGIKYPLKVTLWGRKKKDLEEALYFYVLVKPAPDMDWKLTGAYKRVKGKNIWSMNSPALAFWGKGPAEKRSIYGMEIDGAVSGGIGVLLTSSSNGVAVVRVAVDSSAEESGLLPGDLITKVDGQAIASIPFYSACALLRGPTGSVVNVTLLAVADGKTRDVKIKRQLVDPEKVKWREGAVTVTDERRPEE